MWFYQSPQCLLKIMINFCLMGEMKLRDYRVKDLVLASTSAVKAIGYFCSLKRTTLSASRAKIADASLVTILCQSSITESAFKGFKLDQE